VFKLVTVKQRRACELKGQEGGVSTYSDFQRNSVSLEIMFCCKFYTWKWGEVQ